MRNSELPGDLLLILDSIRDRIAIEKRLNTFGNVLSENILYHGSMHIGEAEVAALETIDESSVI